VRKPPPPPSLPPIEIPSPDEWLNSLNAEELRAVVREQMGEIYDLREFVKQRQEESYEIGFLAGYASRVKRQRWGGD
jgi:hypothetical protein